MIKLTEQQKLKFKEIVEDYIKDEEIIKEDLELDKNRDNIAKELITLIKNFLNDQISIESFKTPVDSINKKNALWGFRGMNGQMFFNMLYNNCKDKEELINQLKNAIELPNSTEEANKKIIDFQSYVESIYLNIEDKRKAPNPKRILYFLTYFWQIQNKDKFPTFYTSLKESFIELNLLEPSDDLSEFYLNFYNLNFELLKILKEISGDKLNTLWQLEHVIWRYYNQETEKEPEVKEKVKTELSKLDISWIPPILSDFPELAKNDRKIIELYEKDGKNVPTIFENKTAKIFGILGYDVEELGQGKGNNPDGIAKAEEENYILIYDSKVREDGFNIGTEDRKIKDYIETQQNIYKGKNIFFLIITSSYHGNGDDFKNKVKNIQMSTRVRDIVVLEAELLLYLLELKLRYPNDINLHTLHEFFIGKTGIITKEQIDSELRPR